MNGPRGDWDFTEQDQQGFLQVDRQDPLAAAQVGHWHAHCRALARNAVTVILADDRVNIEVVDRQGKLGRVDARGLLDHQDIGASSSGFSTFRGQGRLTVSGIPLQNLDHALGHIWALIAQPSQPPALSCNPQQPTHKADPFLRPLEGSSGPHEDDPSCSVSVKEILFYQRTPAIWRLRRPEVEYQMIACALDHLAGSGARPVLLHPMCSGGPPLHPGRLLHVSPGLLAKLEQIQDPCEHEERFDPTLVVLSGENAWFTSRPAVCLESGQAVVWCRAPAPEPKFEGYLVLGQDGQGWKVRQVSHDQDWQSALGNLGAWNPKHNDIGVIDPHWNQVCLDFPASSAPWHNEAERQASQILYQALLEGQHPLGDLACIPIFPMAAPGVFANEPWDGRRVSCNQLIRWGQLNGELCWDIPESEIALQLAHSGELVVSLGDQDLHAWKLMAGLGKQFSCPCAEFSRQIPRAISKSDSVVRLCRQFQRLFHKAGFPDRQFDITSQDQFRFQPQASPCFSAQTPEGLLNLPGTIWLPRFECEGWQRTFGQLLGTLLHWADPERVYWNRVWDAAVAMQQQGQL